MNKENVENIDVPSVDQLTELTERFLLEGLSFKDLKGISDEDMEGIYAVGFNLYNNGKYEDALKVFQFLCFFDHFNRKYWMALGGARQMLKSYKDAIDAYSVATVLKVHDPMAPLQAASCYLALGDAKSAKSALHCAIKYSGDNKEIKSRAEALLEFLEKKGKDIK
ncbi:MAG: SycD/LcrH family type III secretion system chaperone VcrH [Opitutales bacterium]|tara:strand:- start:395 stop:892 length:498 start_codon:yes stop_codon:yes gene_type:complete